MDQMTVGALAKEAHVNLQTIRFYEREGLIAEPSRTASGYRMFSPDVVRRVRFVKHAQELGFSLAEIKELLALRVSAKTSCTDIRQRTQNKITDVQNKIRSLQAIEKALERLTAACHGSGPVSECPILENLDPKEYAR
jgi:MerR family copper efflux transcriptional regulator